MSRFLGSMTAFFLLATLASNPLFGQEEKHVIIEKRVSDSTTSHFLASKVDTEKVQSGWPKLQRGMQEKEVKALLGKPTAVEEQASDHSTTWYYGERFVIFDSIKGVLRDWQKR